MVHFSDTHAWVRIQHKAAFQGSLDCLKFLVSQGAEVNRKDNTISTPLHLAAYQGQLECIQFLVQSGAKTTEVSLSFFRFVLLRFACFTC